MLPKRNIAYKRYRNVTRSSEQVLICFQSVVSIRVSVDVTKGDSFGSEGRNLDERHCIRSDRAAVKARRHSPFVLRRPNTSTGSDGDRTSY